MKMETNKIYNMDCLEGMKQLVDESVDLVVTDPPYNASNSKISFADKHYTALDEEWDKGFTLDFLPLVSKKVRNGGSILVYCSHHLLGKYLTEHPKELKVRQIIHWRKNGCVPSICNRLYAWSIEYIIWFTKGTNYTFNKKKWDNYTDMITTNLKDKQKIQLHPTQKHLYVMRKLIEVHSNEGDLILDCFSGSGTTAVACIQTERNFIGYEIDEKYYNISLERIKSVKSQTKLPNGSFPNGEFNRNLKDLSTDKSQISADAETSLNNHIKRNFSFGSLDGRYSK